MQSRDRTLVPVAISAPVPLPSLSSAFSRRRAVFGAVAATGFLATAGASAMANGTPPIVNPADAALIEFASRTVALARRQDAVLRQRIDAESAIDQWNFANSPDEPEMPKARSRMVITDLSTATHRIMQFSDPLDGDDGAQGEADLLAYKEACKAHKRAVADKMAQSRVPYLTKLADRMWQRLIRSVERLTDMQPTTLAGLAAKASVIEALAETDSDTADWWGRNLGRSVAEDAIRLHASSTVV